MKIKFRGFILAGLAALSLGAPGLADARPYYYDRDWRWGYRYHRPYRYYYRPRVVYPAPVYEYRPYRYYYRNYYYPYRRPYYYHRWWW